MIASLPSASLDVFVILSSSRFRAAFMIRSAIPKNVRTWSHRHARTALLLVLLRFHRGLRLGSGLGAAGATAADAIEPLHLGMCAWSPRNCATRCAHCAHGPRASCGKDSIATAGTRRAGHALARLLHPQAGAFAVVAQHAPPPPPSGGV